MDEGPKTRRRWFQFSVGTMLLLVTALAAFLAYHVTWIRQRHQFLGSPRSFSNGLTLKELDPTLPTPRAPGLLWLFGEEPQGAIYVNFGDPASWEAGLTNEQAAELDRVDVLFPEAAILVGGHRQGEHFIGVKRLR
jgi:hypothetical protein